MKKKWNYQRCLNVLATLALLLLTLNQSVLAMPARGGKPMAIDFGGADMGQYIDYGTLSAVQNLATKSICFWVYQDTYETEAYSVELYQLAAPYTNSAWAILLNWANDGDILFSEGFSDTAGIWRTTSGGYITTGAWHHVCLTYNSGATTYDPIIYVDGASKGITEIDTPVGTASSGTNAVMRIGGAAADSARYPIDGKISDVRIYNRILTAGEVLSIASTRCMTDNDYGLVFHAPFVGAAGLTAFDGATLAAGNTIRDRIGGAIGTPSGSPVGYAETYLSVCP